VVHGLLQQTLAGHQLYIQAGDNTQHGQPGRGGRGRRRVSVTVNGWGVKGRPAQTSKWQDNTTATLCWRTVCSTATITTHACYCDQMSYICKASVSSAAGSNLSMAPPVHGHCGTVAVQQCHPFYDSNSYLPLTVSGIGPSKAWY
jgi:hypothetical protein